MGRAFAEGGRAFAHLAGDRAAWSVPTMTDLSPRSSEKTPNALIRVAPWLFVLIWSTGWIAAGFGAADADPLTFLSLRYALAAFCLLVLIRLTGAPWPARHIDAVHAMVSGVLLHAIYLGGVWWAVHKGLPAGISGLIAALQPILTALLAPLLVGERITSRQWAGVLAGLGGIALVLQPKLAAVEAGQIARVAVPILVNGVAMVSVTLGTFYQKRYIATGDLRTVTALQYVGAGLVTLPVAMALEPMRLVWTPSLLLTMAWSVLALSLGAIGLLLLLIRRGEVSRAATLIYLVPPTVAVQAYLFFGETLTAIQILGLFVTVGGVALAVRR